MSHDSTSLAASLMSTFLSKLTTNCPPTHCPAHSLDFPINAALSTSFIDPHVNFLSLVTSYSTKRAQFYTMSTLSLNPTTLHLLPLLLLLLPPLSSFLPLLLVLNTPLALRFWMMTHITASLPMNTMPMSPMPMLLSRRHTTLPWLARMLLSGSPPVKRRCKLGR